MFFVSGAIGSRNSGKGTSLFGGDVFSSGSIASAFGISGSLTQLVDGTSYLAAGANVTITSASNGQIILTSTDTDTQNTLDQAYDEGGTGISLKNNNFIIRGKTGTAQMTSSSTENLISWFGGYIEYHDNLMSLLVMIEDTNSDTKSIAKALSKEIINFQLSRGDK